MRVFIAGIDGYVGWSLAQYLAARSHEIAGVDGGYQRDWVAAMGSWSAVPIVSMEERVRAFKEKYEQDLYFYPGDLREYSLVKRVFEEFEPDAVVHLSECPSAP